MTNEVAEISFTAPYSNMTTPTPETDAEESHGFDEFGGDQTLVSSGFARKLERERDAARIIAETNRELNADLCDNVLPKLERERDEMKLAFQKSLASYESAHAINVSLREERDQLRKAADELAMGIQTNDLNPLRRYAQLWHVIERNNCAD